MAAENELRIRTAAEVGPGPDDADRRVVLSWCRDFLLAPHPELGRTGAVCPYTGPALKRDVIHLVTARDTTDLGAAVDGLREWYLRTAEGLAPEDAELLTLLILLPDMDPADPRPLDELQARLKTDFVAAGLMIGQFHPRCANPGLWNTEFRPLRSPVPLLAIRRMVVFDLPFLTEDTAHFEAWLSHFASHLPPRIRTQLTMRVLS